MASERGNGMTEKDKYWNIHLKNDKGRTTNAWVYAPPDNLALAMKLAENAKPGFKAIKAMN
jgi:hypothetical protein